MPLTAPVAVQMLTVAAALEMWHKHRIRANRAYTPKAMMQTAEQLTGLKFKPREYMKAAQALREKVYAETQVH